MSIWKHCHVRWDFITSLCASVPADPDIHKGWLEARKPSVMPAGGKSIGEIQEEIFNTLPTEDAEADKQEQRSKLIFQRVNGELVLRASTFRSHLKDCARILSREHVGKIKGEASFATRFINSVYHDEKVYWVRILDQDGNPRTEADDTKSKAVHTWDGRSALKNIEYVMGARVEFDLKVLGKKLKLEDIATVMDYGGVHGYGGERGDGEGRYQAIIIEREEEDNGRRSEESRASEVANG